MVLEPRAKQPPKMKVTTILNYLLSSIVLFQAPAFAEWRQDVARVGWDGIGVYIAVDEQKVQEKVDEILAGIPGAPPLYVPDTPVVHGVEEGQHAVFIDFGYQSLTDFADESSDAPRTASSTLVIPFLSAEPGGLPKYNLGLAQLRESQDMGLPDPFLMSPPRKPGVLRVSRTEASWRGDGEEIVVRYSISDPCKEAAPYIREEFEDVIIGDSWFDSSTPDFGYCSRHPDISSTNQYCSILERILPAVEKDLPNVCATFTPVDAQTCSSTIEITKITPGLRDMLLLGANESINIIASERFLGDYTSGLKYPCV